MPSSSTFSPTLYFGFLDYTIFIALLVISIIIGIYFGFISKQKQNTTVQYLLGGKNMQIWPIAASLIVSHISGITMLGVPAEIYIYGTQYWAFLVCSIVVCLVMSYIYLPVFYDLQLTSCFAYLEKRFDKNIRVTASLVYAISVLIFLPLLVYVPALAFSQVTGINLHLVTPITCLICIFYTTFGGLKAVVWTDTLQFVAIIGSSFLVIFLGISSAGGVQNIWEIAERGQRLVFFNMDPNPLVRSSFWTVSFGMTTMWLALIGVSQGSVQRFLSVPDINDAKKTVWMFTIGMVILKSFSCFTGLLLYAHYETCDPVSAGTVEKFDQLLPYYIMEVTNSIPGLPGLFIAGIFSAALSSMSSHLNTLSGVIYEDILRRQFPNASEKTASNCMKILVVILGIISIGLVFVVERLGEILNLSYSLHGITSGALLGIFSIGMLIPSVNTKGVICGAIVSMFAITFILVGTKSKVNYTKLPLRTDGCNFTFSNVTEAVFIMTTLPSNTTTISPDQPTDEVHWLFRISFMYYTLIGMSIVFIIGYSVSLCTGGCDEIDERLLAPFLRSYYRRQRARKERKVNYTDVKLNIIK